MARIHVITPNPCYDLFQDNDLKISSAGKGINVCKSLERLNLDYRCYTFTNENEQVMFNKLLDSNIKVIYSSIDQNIRTLAKTNFDKSNLINKTKSFKSYEYTQNNLKLSRENVDDLFNKLVDEIFDVEEDYVLLCGSCYPSSMMKYFLKKLNILGFKKIIVDTSKRALYKAIYTYKAFILKPNYKELVEAVGNDNDYIDIDSTNKELFVKEFFERNKKLSKNSHYYITDENNPCYIKSKGSDLIKHELKSISQVANESQTNGAGDRTLAYLLFFLNNGLDFEKSVVLSVDCVSEEIKENKIYRLKDLKELI